MKGNDHFIVVVIEERFVVFGLNAEPGQMPRTAWWQANLEPALKQACKKQ